MKVFAVYARVELMEKPSWLDEFRAKYDKPFDDHVTLKQPCFIDQAQTGVIRDQCTEFFKNFSLPAHSIEIVFSRPRPDRADGSIMIDAEENPELTELQKGIVTTLKSFRDYVREESEMWEKNFMPHITIARDLEPQQFQEAMKDLPKEVRTTGVIREIVLVFASTKDAGTEKVEERTVYQL